MICSSVNLDFLIRPPPDRADSTHTWWGFRGSGHWGNRELAGVRPETLDDVLSEIKREFWEQAAPHPLHCFHDSSLVQTLRLGNTVNPARYWHLMLNGEQVRGVWSRKRLHARLANRIRRRPRISFWQHHDTH